MMELHADVYESLVIYALQGDDAVYCFPILLALNRKFNEITIRVLRGMTASYKDKRFSEPYPISDMMDGHTKYILLRLHGGGSIFLDNHISYALTIRACIPSVDRRKHIRIMDMVSLYGQSGCNPRGIYRRRISLVAFLRRLYPELWADYRDPRSLRMWLSDRYLIVPPMSAIDPHDCALLAPIMPTPYFHRL